MTTEKSIEAAQVDPIDAFVQEAIDQDSETATTDEPITDSAPVEDAIIPESTEAEKPKEDGFQKRIDKVTADKYAEKRRADDLQKKIDAYEAKPKETLKEPTLADHDYDEDAHEQASIKYKIDLGVQNTLAAQQADAKAEQQQTAQAKVQGDFNDRISALGKEDFAAKADLIPTLPNGVADALMQAEDGAAMIYHLGSNPSKADAISQMSPSMAIMELGKLSTQLSTKPETKLSAAPDPIEPVKAGSSLSSAVDDDMSMDDWMRKFG